MRFIFGWLLVLKCFAGEAIPVIWQDLKGGYEWDSDWIKEILSEVPIVHVYDGEYKEVIDRAIVVAYGNQEYEGYFQKFIEKGYKFGVIHLSDENYTHSTAHYEKASFVLRNLWHEKFQDQKNVYVYPLGYAGGFWKNGNQKKVKKISDRSYVWSFAGQVSKSTRKEMIAHMKTIKKHYFHKIKSFDDPKSLPHWKYREVMQNTMFIPCPRGFVNVDSFRVWEALECGCIPIVEKDPTDYFTQGFGPNPFLSVTNWSEAPELIQHLLDHPKQLKALQDNCYRWWMDYKKQMKQDIKEIVLEAFD